MRESGQIPVSDWENFFSPQIFLSKTFSQFGLSLKDFFSCVFLVLVGGLMTFSQKLSTPPLSFLLIDRVSIMMAI